MRGDCKEGGFDSRTTLGGILFLCVGGADSGKFNLMGGGEHMKSDREHLENVDNCELLENVEINDV